MLIDQDLQQLIKVILVVVGAILPIVNPVGSAPMFLAMTHGADSATRRALAGSIAVNSFLLLMGSLLLGNFVLRLFGLSIPVVQFAGGLVLCRLGWKLLSDDAPAAPTDTGPADTQLIMRAFYPLTLPLTVDPGAISVAVAIGANHAHNVESVLVAIVGAIVGVVIISFTVWLAYRYAERVSTWLGHTKMMVVLRLSAFIVLCIGVQIAWNGAKALIEELANPSEPAAMPFAPAAGK
ncbi:MAG: MarC family protein [Casimicrobiaceae bacterium]